MDDTLVDQLEGLEHVKAVSPIISTNGYYEAENTNLGFKCMQSIAVLF